MKVALVTGGATGIGAATVEALAAEGIAVAIQLQFNIQVVKLKQKPWLAS